MTDQGDCCNVDRGRANLNKALTDPSVMTKPIFFMVEYSSMLLILNEDDSDGTSGQIALIFSDWS